ncbi:O-antigen ligase family protein [Arthrobacter sp. FW306-07-I]|uniref:O-antigen ligase family protein n=1 Tax=Arthrobacter sp. FW306-07-I TaxID=2879622 RepID=UPI001F47E7F5|nr:O-antigen ligase family protein [Arthrobacter sp. FW306-07-I]UKA74579.1 O-antigen ligase family protein [Arthrobacter sp. FW306-07-I]
MTSGGIALVAAATKRETMIGIRTLLMAALAGLSTFDPAFTLSIAPVVSIAVLILGRPLTFKIDPPVLLAVLFALWAWMSMTWTTAEDFTSATAVLWSEVLLIFIAAYDLIKSRSQLRMIAAGFVTGAVFTVAKNLYFGPDLTETAATGGRAVLGNANINYVAYALVTALVLIVVLWVSRGRTKFSVLLLGAASAVVIAGIMATDTRAAQVGAAGIVAWSLVCAVIRRQPLKLLVGVVLVAAFCIVTGIADQASLAYESGTRVTGDWSGRLIIWPIAREMWAENPVVGLGAGAFTIMNGLGIGAHNFVLQTGTGLGLIGVGLLVALMWTALAGSRQPLLIGAFLAGSAPLYLSGMWEASPAAWVAMAVFARLKVLDSPRREQDPPAANQPNAPDWVKVPQSQYLIRPNAGPIR